MKIVLASGSPRRSELMTQIGYAFTVEVSDAEEIDRADTPAEICLFNASKKAAAVFALHAEEEVCVIAADTIVVLDNEVLGKPGNAGEASEMLRKISGKAHRVLTGVSSFCRRASGEVRQHQFVEETTVHVADISEAEITAYVKSGEPMDKAGAYGIQGMFARYIERIEGDYFNVMGLPVGRLYREVLKEN